MPSGGFSFKGGTYEGKVVLDVSSAITSAQELDKALTKVGNALVNMAKGRDTSALWNEQAASIENVSNALEEFRKNEQSIGKAENLTKALNAFMAFNPDALKADIFKQLGDDADELIAKAGSLAKNLDSAFSVQSLRDAFGAFQQLKEAGVDLETIFEKLRQGDVSGLTAEVDRLEKTVQRANNRMSRMQETIDRYESGAEFSMLQKQLERLQETTRRSQEEFAAFVSSLGYVGDDIDPDSLGRFSDYFDQISRGTLTSKEAIAKFKNEYSHMFSFNDQNGLDIVLDKLSELGMAIESVRESTVAGGGSTSDSLAGQFTESAESAQRASQSAIEFANAFSGVSEQLASVISRLEDILNLVSEINSKNFNIQNVFQAGGGEAEAASQLRVYRAEAIALNQYLTSLRNVITSVANESRGMTSVLLTMGDQLEALMGFDPERLSNKIGSADTAGKIDAITAQLKSYYDAMMSIANALQNSGIELVIPDTARIDAAAQSVADFDNQSKKMAETFAKEAADAAAASAGMQQVAAQSAEIKLGAPEAGDSFEQILSNLDAINNILPTIGENIRSAFDFSEAVNGVKSIKDVIAGLMADQKIQLSVDEAGLSTLKKSISDAVAGISNDVTIKINKVEFTPEAQEAMKNATSILGTSGSVKFDESALSSLSKSVEDAITRASANIKLTIDNVEVTQSAQNRIAKTVSDAASGSGGGKGGKGGGGGSSGGGGGGDSPDSDDVKFIQQMIRLHEQLGLQISKNTEAYRANKDVFDMFYDALSTSIDSVKDKLDGFTGDIRDAGKVTEETISGMQTVVSKIIGDTKVDEAEAGRIADEVEQIYKLIDAENALAESEEKKARDMDADWYAEETKRAKAAEKTAIAEAKRTQSEIESYNKAEDAAEEAEKKRIKAAEEADKKIVASHVEASYKEAQGIEDAASEKEKAWRKSEEAAAKEAEAVERATQKEIEDYNRVADAAERAATKRADTLTAQLDKIDIGAPSSGLKFADNTESMQRYAAAIGDARQAVENLRNSTDQDREATLEYANSAVEHVRALRDEFNAAAIDADKLANVQKRASDLSLKITEWSQKNPKAYGDVKAQVDSWLATLNSEGQLSVATLNEIAAGFNNISAQERMAGNNGQTFFQKLKAGWSKFGGWSLATKSFMTVINTFKKSVDAVKEIDSAMTELKKVTDLTSKEYEQFGETAISMANTVGAKLSDVINSAADFSRLGYNIADATELSKAALIYMNVGDSIEDVGEATSSIISTMKAFGIEAANSMSIIDMFNEVGKELLPMPVVTRCLEECYIGQSSIALSA